MDKFISIYTYSEIINGERERETDRQTERERERQTWRQTFVLLLFLAKLFSLMARRALTLDALLGCLCIFPTQ